MAYAFSKENARKKRCGENTQIKRPKRYTCFLKNTKVNYSAWNADLGDEHKEKQSVFHKSQDSISWGEWGGVGGLYGQAIKVLFVELDGR